MGYLIYMAPTQKSMKPLFGNTAFPTGDLGGFHAVSLNNSSPITPSKKLLKELGLDDKITPLRIVIKQAQSPQDEIRAIFTAFHEISHGLAQGDGSANQPITEMGYGRDASPKITYRGSVESELAVIFNRISAKVPDSKYGQDIAKEIVNIRFTPFGKEGAKLSPVLKGDSIIPRDGTMMQEIREDVELTLLDDQYGKDTDIYKEATKRQVENKFYRDNYELNISEVLADSIAVYLLDPKKFKEKAPLTAEFLKNSLNSKPSSKFVKFYANPIATILAVLMTALALDDDKEEEQPQMQPGALDLGQGALSA